MATNETTLSIPFPPVKFEFSPTIGVLMGALAKARKAFKPIIKSETNPFFKSKYADLASVIEATKDGLSDNGLAVLQPPVFDRATGTVEIITLLAHESGEWLKSTLDMPTAKADAQGVGSAITYGRRYAYSAVLNVASEEDDDGNGAVSGQFKRAPVKEETPEEFDQRTADQQNISPEQITAIDTALKRTLKSEQEIIAALGFIGEKRIEHIKKNQFQKFLKWANSESKLKPASQIQVDTRTRAMKRLWATAAELSIPEQDVKTCAYEKFHVDSMTKLTETQIDEMTAWVRSVAAAVLES